MADEHLTEEDLARLESLGVGSLVTAGEFARLVAEVRRLRDENERLRESLREAARARDEMVFDGEGF